MAVVCGKEPIFVVGRSGKFNHAFCNLMRSENGDLRWSAFFGKFAKRSATQVRWISREFFRASAAA